MKILLEIFKSQESGHLEKLTLKTLEKGAWINIIDPTPYELKEVSAACDVEPDFLRAALDDEERSHIDVEDESIMILTNVPVVYEEENYDTYDTLPLSVILTKKYIITVCLEETPVIASFNERTARLFHTYKKTQFLFEILFRTATFFLRYFGFNEMEINATANVPIKSTGVKDPLSCLFCYRDDLYVVNTVESNNPVVTKNFDGDIIYTNDTISLTEYDKMLYPKHLSNGFTNVPTSNVKHFYRTKGWKDVNNVDENDISDPKTAYRFFRC